ncbi:hypothetical protein FACS18949_13270 [Clostridia bacterium]|nr:hypothetical protein FACS18949_13270 [Clostridia bacterium]
MPLQGRSAKNGNSLFLDDNFEPYDDQLEYLSSLRKIQAKAIENFLSELHGSELGLLLATDEEIAKPWEKKTIPQALTAIDFPQELQLVRANGIHIAKTGCSERALNRIKRLAAFKNPEFYKAQAMRLATYDKPRIIDTSYENNEYLSIPRGCEEGLLELLDGANVAYNIEDKRTQGSTIKVSFNGTLRDEQAIAAKQLLKCDNGILSATTAFGKTVVGAYVIAEKKVNALILVHTSALLEQWKKSLLQFLTIEELPTEQPKGRRKKLSIIGQLGSSKNTLSGKIDIAIIQSLVNGDEVKELIKDYGLVIVDECHHVSAVSFERVLKAVNAKYVYGLTATPTRQDGQQAIIYMQCGKIRYKVDAKTQAEDSGFERFVVPRFSSLRKPISITDKDIVKLYGIIASDVQRNAMIVSDIVNALKKGRTPIVLTGRWVHVALLADELEKVCPNIIRLTGKTPAKEKREALERLQAIPQGEPFVIVATGKYVGEGFDEPRLDTLFLVSPIAWKGTLQQYAGRLHREYEGKESVIIYDYVDMHIKPLERMYHKRVSAYFGMGYKSLNENKSSEQVGVIFDNKSFQPVCEKDIHAAKHEIVVASPLLRKNRVQQMMRLFSAAQINGVKIIVATRPAENYKLAEQPNILPLIETLSVSGIQVVEKLNLHQRFAVIDQNIVWYGSINLLAYGTTDESIMRFENADIAGELLDILI